MSKNPEIKSLERKNKHIAAKVHMSTKTTKSLQEIQIERGVPKNKTITVATASATRWSGKIESARRNNIIMEDVDRSFQGKAQSEFQAEMHAAAQSQQRLVALMAEAGAADDLEESDEEDGNTPEASTATAAAAAADDERELTINEIMSLEPKTMVMSASEKVMITTRARARLAHRTSLTFV